jgi:twitching motility protein PilT
MDIDELLHEVVARKASDLHLRVPSPPMLRVNGELVPLAKYAGCGAEDVREVFEHITDEIDREKFHNELELDLAYSVPGLARFRVNVSRQRGTLSLAFRHVAYTIPTIDELGLPSVCKALALRKKGLIVVTGPTGSGKSTTLAAMIGHLNKHASRNVICIEDPIEFLHRNDKCLISQRELGGDTRAFSAALKHCLRQDPDVILVGEMRDLDTIGTAITAAETGHLVLTTLHTNTAAQTVDRIIDAFPQGQQSQVRMQVAVVLEAVLSQTLVPKADGSGRAASFEIMIGTDSIRNLIRENKVYQIPTYIHTGAQYQMHTMEQSLHKLLSAGVITRETALTHCNSPEELLILLGGVKKKVKSLV